MIFQFQTNEFKVFDIFYWMLAKRFLFVDLFQKSWLTNTLSEIQWFFWTSDSLGIWWRKYHFNGEQHWLKHVLDSTTVCHTYNFHLTINIQAKLKISLKKSQNSNKQTTSIFLRSVQCMFIFITLYFFQKFIFQWKNKIEMNFALHQSSDWLRDCL